jgi:LuxR family transcriptional regulator, maltose regulon positive regulatory protein
MPRYASHQLRWSEQAQSYILSIGEQVSAQTLTSAWLEQIASFSFRSRSGVHYTVRKQKVQRGTSYWYGYRRLDGRIVKRYLGKTADLTFARLEEIARLLESTSGSRQSSFSPERETAWPQPTANSSHVENAVHPSPVVAPPLLLSKLSPPRLRANLLDRSRLFALLDAGRECHLTLLSAPAGFGKTTLVCQWMAACGMVGAGLSPAPTIPQANPDFPPAVPPMGVAWLSLEASDNDPLRFWRYLITACQTFQVDLQEAHDALLDTIPQPPYVPSSLETMLTTLLNALARCPSGGILVLEDYHLITAQEIHTTLSFFLDHLPTNIHLILITRSDPPFSLARLRARNDLCEIRVADLRFSREEMTSLLQQALSFPLATESIQRLHAQLEGWGAGLHLLKLALQRTNTPAEGEQVLTLFPTSNLSFQEYFVSEVLDLQAEAVQQFLLQTSILNRLTGSLCDAVVEQQNSQDMLTLLERANLFLEPLDSAGQWYRYHALFRGAMRNEARRRLGEEQLRCLATRASRWYEGNDLLSEAIDAALDAQDYGRAASLIERFAEMPGTQDEMHESHTLRRWLEQLPEAILKQHPVLCLNYATTLLFLNTAWRLSQLALHDLERLLDRAEQSFLEENNLPKLGELFAFRSLLAWRQDETRAAASYAQQALNWLPETQKLWRVLSLCMVGRGWIETGQFPQARAALLEARDLCKAMKNYYFTLVSAILLAQVFFEQGQLQQASSLYRQVLAEARADEMAGTLCPALTGLAALSYEWNELENAYQQAQEVIALSRPRGLLLHEVRATLIQVRVQQAQSQVTAARQQLATLLDRIPASLSHLSQEIQATQARLALATGDHMTMQRWATGRSAHPPHPDFSQQLEEELLLTRWLRIQGKHEEAAHQLERLLATAQEAEHTRRMFEIQVEMVRVALACKRKTEAQQLLREVLVQAFDGNYMRLFLDAGEPMAILLRSLLPQLHEPPLFAYVHTLLNAFPAQPQSEDQTVSSVTSSLVEPLSPQEMRVLHLLVQHRSNAEIADALVVSVNTIRTQVQSIYHKLGVHKRSAVGEIARELHLL